jgi:hypothetical protein
MGTLGQGTIRGGLNWSARSVAARRLAAHSLRILDPNAFRFLRVRQISMIHHAQQDNRGVLRPRIGCDFWIDSGSQQKTQGWNAATCCR